MSTKRSYWKITVWFNGIASRDRKVKRHSIDLAEYPDDGSKPEIPWSLHVKANNELQAYKQVTGACINVQPWSEENGFEGFLMFDPRAFKLAVTL